ncbi:uncharacterized protein LOC132620088 [Lycium barbarum]|uniref:uncharacterized protein LOC132620088 n=1 Tax=Lycium barbarum TaxID=112863 RepID=UPI00293E8679|nr:uncharacterized protein LOC132620088 [Lycium barbarum]
MEFKVSFTKNNNVAEIEILTGSNYKKWKHDVDFDFELVEMDMIIIKDAPTEPTEESNDEEKNEYAKWERLNRLCLKALKRSIAEHLLGSLLETDSAKEFFETVGEHFQVSDNAEASRLMGELRNLKYDETVGVHQFILRMVCMQNQLKNLDVTLPDSFIVHEALLKLPSQFSQMRTAYNTSS